MRTYRARLRQKIGWASTAEGRLEPADMKQDPNQLVDFLRSIPGIQNAIGAGELEVGWWGKFSIDISVLHAWHIVQEFGCVLNYLSLNERLPTVFKPVSPATYMNGGPADFLSWVIECEDCEFSQTMTMKWLEARLPAPANAISSWAKLEY